MSTPAFLGPEHRRLLADASTVVLLPDATPEAAVEGTVQTAAVGSTPTLRGFRTRSPAAGGASADAGTVELQAFVRERLIAASLPARERSGGRDAGFVGDYLEREARRELAMRSLDLPEGAAHAGPIPLDELILTREAQLPAGARASLVVDGRAARATTVAARPGAANRPRTQTGARPSRLGRFHIGIPWNAHP